MLMIPTLIILSIMFTQLSHPLSMGLVLLMQTTLIAITVGLSTYTFWFSYILFLVFLGGMLVLFIYVASLASNEPFSFSLFPSFLFSLLPIMIILSITYTMSDLLMTLSISSLAPSSMFSFLSSQIIISWIYNTPSMAFTIFIISYLLLMLVVVVKITTLYKGPLRLS
nr:NADH dehydrogenase subunit 6 [Percnon planissimum]